MGLAIPDTTLRTAAGTDVGDFMSNAKSFFSATSTKFSIVANGGESGTYNGSWTLTAVDVNETWYINFRRVSTTLVKVLIDPLGNVTGPGIPNITITNFPNTTTIEATGAGFVTKNVQINDVVTIVGGTNAGAYTVASIVDENNITVSPSLTAGAGSGEVHVDPHLTDATESSGERDIWQIVGGGSENTQYYINELDDALFIMHLNSGSPTHLPRGIHAGRVYVPFFTDGTNGDDYADGLGLFGYEPDYQTATTDWVGTKTAGSSLSRIRTSQTTWHGVGAHSEPVGSTDIGRINLKEKLRPMIINATNADGSAENMIGYTKYLLMPRVVQLPGVVLDGGVGLDAWCHFHSSNVNDYHVMPWNRLVVPIF